VGKHLFVPKEVFIKKAGMHVCFEVETVLFQGGDSSLKSQKYIFYLGFKASTVFAIEL
jgi:hypothetical protein